VSVDSIEIELRSGSEFTPDLWHAARARALAETQAQLTSMNTGLVIVDDNMYYASMIKPYKTLTREVGAKFAHILLEVDLETALQRNGSRTG
jgi:tRNA uridine 5-carbamoylmethylation protein Kti12